MPDPRTSASLREATLELYRYLSGEIAPLMAVDAIEPFVAHPPEIAARIIGEWIEAQLQGPEIPVPVSNLVFHVLQKLHDFSESELVVKERLTGYLEELSRILVQFCPETERDALKLRLSRIGENETVLASRAEYLFRERDPERDDRLKNPEYGRARRQPAAPAATRGFPRHSTERAAVGDSRRLSLLLDRLERVRFSARSENPAGADTTLLAQAISTAALHSKSDDEFARCLDRVRRGGVEVPMGKIFRALGWNLPGWTIPAGDTGEAEPPPPGRPIQAMNRIVALAPDAQERAKRWGEMIYAAIEQLNEGRLAQAVSIIEAAKRLIAEKNADAKIVKQVLGQAQDAISGEVLRRLVEVPEKHGLVRKVLEFFPAYQPEELLKSLEGETLRERRKLFLALLECHGKNCRDLVLTRLGACLNGGPPDELGYFRRNLAFLLRRIPRTRDERLDEEVALLGSMVARGEPAISAKEAVGALGQLRRPDAERILILRLRQLESESVSGVLVEEAWELMDRLCASLARHGTKDAIRAVAGHAFNRSAALGDAMARFEPFSRLDLSVDPEQLAIILDTIKALLPSKVLGFVVKRSNHDLACLIHAVSGTPAENVRFVLRKISEKFHGHALGEQAEKALAKLDPRARTAVTPEETLSGDLDVFGLPGLLQSLASSQSTGELVLFDRRQSRQAAIAFSGGQLARCQAGQLNGEDALYQVLEKPFPGTFVFRAATDGTTPAHEGAALDLMGMILEGLRRHEEYQLARALAPEGISLEPGEAAAICPEEETDDALARSVWTCASAGAPPEVCEAEAATDPFRVRRLLAYWIERGALRPRLSSHPARPSG